MKTPARSALLISVAIVLAGCGTSGDGAVSAEDGTSRASSAPEQKYAGTGMVLEEEGHEPVFCLGGVRTSLPPQCGGVRLVGWDWDAVEDEESASGATWGTYELTGFYDVDSFEVVEAGPPSPPSDDHDDEIATACPEPEGGWKSPNPDLTSEEDRQRAIAAARAETDFAGAWIDYIGEPTEFADPKDNILDLAFTGDLERHERDARKLWGGPLCLSQHKHTLKRLREIQEEAAHLVEERGLQVTWSSSSENRNVVELGVDVIDAATQEELDRRYGEGTVEVSAQLQPVE